MKEIRNYKTYNLLIINRFLQLKFHIKVTLSFENHYAYCEVIAKAIPDLDDVIMVLNFMAGCS